MADEQELAKRVQHGQEARQTLERIDAELRELEDEWVSKFKQCPSGAHEDRLMIQCQLNAIDGLRAQFVYKVDDAKVAERELSLIEKAREGVSRLFG